MGRLGITTPGVSRPPTSSREGAGHLWSSAVHEVIFQRQQEDVEMPSSARTPQYLDLNLEKDFLKHRSQQVPAVFTGPLFTPSMANAVYEVFMPSIPPRTPFSTGDSQVPSTSTQPGGEPNLSTLQEVGTFGVPEKPTMEEFTPSTSETGQPVSDSDSDKTEESSPKKDQTPPLLQIELPTWSLWKHDSRAAAGKSRDGATPSKMRKEKELEDAETAASTEFYRRLYRQPGSSCTIRI